MHRIAQPQTNPERHFPSLATQIPRLQDCGCIYRQVRKIAPLQQQRESYIFPPFLGFCFCFDLALPGPLRRFCSPNSRSALPHPNRHSGPPVPEKCPPLPHAYSKEPAANAPLPVLIHASSPHLLIAHRGKNHLQPLEIHRFENPAVEAHVYVLFARLLAEGGGERDYGDHGVRSVGWF